MTTEKTRRIEPWPLLLTGLLVTMMSISIGFYFIAAHHPDPVLTQVKKPGVVE